MKQLFVFMAALMLASCDNKSDVSNMSPARDVRYYLENPDARKETIAKCNNNPGELENTPDCVNAYDASEEAMNETIDRAIKQE